DDDGSGWDDPEDIEAEIKLNQRLKEFGLVWKNDNQLEKTKRRLYKIGKTPKSTYYDKYDPNGLLTKTAADTTKITNFFNINDT
ncbi:1186_t:CDS:1, partial [Funneliformis geosporum]